MGGVVRRYSADVLLEAPRPRIQRVSPTRCRCRKRSGPRATQAGRDRSGGPGEHRISPFAPRAGPWGGPHADHIPTIRSTATATRATAQRAPGNALRRPDPAPDGVAATSERVNHGPNASKDSMAASTACTMSSGIGSAARPTQNRAQFALRGRSHRGDAEIGLTRHAVPARSAIWHCSQSHRMIMRRVLLSSRCVTMTGPPRSRPRQRVPNLRMPRFERPRSMSSTY